MLHVSIFPSSPSSRASERARWCILLILGKCSLSIKLILGSHYYTVSRTVESWRENKSKTNITWEVNIIVEWKSYNAIEAFGLARWHLVRSHGIFGGGEALNLCRIPLRLSKCFRCFMQMWWAWKQEKCKKHNASSNGDILHISRIHPRHRTAERRIRVSSILRKLKQINLAFAIHLHRSIERKREQVAGEKGMNEASRNQKLLLILQCVWVCVCVCTVLTAHRLHFGFKLISFCRKSSKKLACCCP